MWRYVALSQKLENCIFPGFLVFGQNLEKRLWHYVALCGAMWRYPKKLENCIFPGFLVFGQNLEKRLWHYLALCGAIPKSLKIAVFPVFSFLAKTWKKGCGTMWRNVRYPKKLENCIFPGFLVFGKKGCGTMWRYVALSRKA